jgi:RecB family endonuclease NucS
LGKRGFTLINAKKRVLSGPIDILAISKNKETILVIELKRGRASDIVIGQIQRYMGYVQDELLESKHPINYNCYNG